MTTRSLVVLNLRTKVTRLIRKESSIRNLKTLSWTQKKEKTVDIETERVPKCLF